MSKVAHPVDLLTLYNESGSAALPSHGRLAARVLRTRVAMLMKMAKAPSFGNRFIDEKRAKLLILSAGNIRRHSAFSRLAGDDRSHIDNTAVGGIVGSPSIANSDRDSQGSFPRPKSRRDERPNEAKWGDSKHQNFATFAADPTSKLPADLYASFATTAGISTILAAGSIRKELNQTASGPARLPRDRAGKPKVELFKSGVLANAMPCSPGGNHLLSRANGTSPMGSNPGINGSDASGIASAVDPKLGMRTTSVAEGIGKVSHVSGSRGAPVGGISNVARPLNGRKSTPIEDCLQPALAPAATVMNQGATRRPGLSKRKNAASDDILPTGADDEFALEGKSAAKEAEGTSRKASIEGDVYLDGTLMGRWISRTLARDAGRPPAGGVAFDARRNPLPAGRSIGA